MNISELIERARKDKRKGSITAYEAYKSELSTIAKTSTEYEQGIISLARALRV